MASEWAKWKAEMLFADFKRSGAMGLYDALVEAQERGAQREKQRILAESRCWRRGIVQQFADAVCGPMLEPEEDSRA